MPAYDRFHDVVRTALIKDGWVITDDPLTVRVGERKLFVDLGAEQVIGASKGTRKIAVEIKSFTGLSQMTALHEALGQFVLYREALAEKEPDRELYLAVPQTALDGIFQEEVGRLVRRQVDRFFGCDPEREEKATMASLDKDRDLIERTLCECAQFYSSGETRTLLAFDRLRDQYLILEEGWDGFKRVHFVFVHVELRGSEVWIQKDGTQEGVGVDLMQSGLPGSRVVPAFQQPSLISRRERVAI